MRPIFIYHYNEGITKKKDEFMELFMRDGEKWEKLYASELHQEDLKEDAKSFINIIGSMAVIRTSEHGIAKVKRQISQNQDKDKKTPKIETN